MGLRKMLEGFRRFLDDDTTPPPFALTEDKSTKEQVLNNFPLKLARTVEVAVRQSLLSFPDGLTYAPSGCIVFISLEKSQEIMGRRRRLYETWLSQILTAEINKVIGAGHRAITVRVLLDPTLLSDEVWALPRWDSSSEASTEYAGTVNGTGAMRVQPEINPHRQNE